MMQKVWKEAAILLVIAGGIWYFFAQVDIFPDEDALQISIEHEEVLAEKLNEVFERTFEPVEDSTALQALDVVVDRLMANMEPTDYNYHIHLVENTDVNAFATLGGNIYVFSGLMKFAETPEELAAVLAHEIGHCEERHVVNKMATELGMTILLSIMGGDASLAQELYGSIVANVFSRNQEAEADQFSFDLMERSGLSPTAMATFFRRINRELGSPDEKLEFLMTHPHNNSRIRAAIEFELPDDFEARSFDIDWERAVEGL